VRQADVRAVYQQAVAAEKALLEQLLSACFAARGQDGADAGPLAAALLALMEGAFQLASAAPGVMPAGYAAPMAISLVERYIQGC
jgi:TetR/AcrR family transcriptional repressor of bet genes